MRPHGSKEEEKIILDKVSEVVASSSNLHINQNFQFNSQSTAMQYTNRASIGGRAWMTLKFAKSEMEAAVALWGNTSLGLLMHWWQANKQQSGRGNIGKQALAKMTLLDPNTLSATQLKESATLLKQRADIPMLPFNEIDVDKARAELDEAFLIDILGLPKELAKPGGALELLRHKLADEPSVFGGKRR